MIVVTNERVIPLTWGYRFKRAGQELVMSTQPIGSRPSEWQSSEHAYTRSQMTAALRAALIALVLLGILAVMILL
jgi:hypothetical protein